MISNLTMASFAAVAIVCFAGPVGCIIYAISKKKGANLFTVALMGFAAAMLANQFAGVLMSLKPIGNLLERAFPLYVLISVIILCSFEAIARFFTIKFLLKNKVGYYKGFVLGAGFAAGLVLMQAASYFQLFSQAQLINDGTFVKLVTEQGTVPVEEAIKFQETMQAINPGEYFVQALERGVLVLLQIALTLFLIKCFMEGKQLMGTLITAGIRMAYEFIIKMLAISAGELMNYALNLYLSLALSVIFLAGVIVLCILYLRKTKPVIPVDVIPSPRTKMPVKNDTAKDPAWETIRQINTKELGNEEPESIKEETSKSEANDTKKESSGKE